MTSELKPAIDLRGLSHILSENGVCLDGRISVENIASEIEGLLQQNTRATPSADTLAGLVTVARVWKTKDAPWRIEEPFLRGVTQMKACDDQFDHMELVARDQAAAVIAAKDAECDGYREYAAEKSNQVIAMQAELAQIKAQGAVAVIQFDRRAGNENEMPKVISCNWLANGEYQVYASPVSDSLKAENERLRKLIMDCLKELDRSARPSYAWQLKARAALKGDSNDKG